MDPAAATGSDAESREETVASSRDTPSETLAALLDTLAVRTARQDTFQPYDYRVGIANLLANSRRREELIRLLSAWSRHVRVEARVLEVRRRFATWV